MYDVLVYVCVCGDVMAMVQTRSGFPIRMQRNGRHECQYNSKKEEDTAHACFGVWRVCVCEPMQQK